MASFSKSILSYRDAHQAFEAAGRIGSITLQFEDRSKATTWVSRANAYRVLLREQNAAAGRDFTSEFDHLMVKRKPGESIVTIEPRGFNFAATDLNGNPINLDRVTITTQVLSPHEVSEMEAEAQRFLEEYNLETSKEAKE